MKDIFQSISAKVEDGSPCCDWVGEAVRNSQAYKWVPTKDTIREQDTLWRWFTMELNTVTCNSSVKHINSLKHSLAWVTRYVCVVLVLCDDWVFYVRNWRKCLPNGTRVIWTVISLKSRVRYSPRKTMKTLMNMLLIKFLMLLDRREQVQQGIEVNDVSNSINRQMDSTERIGFGYASEYDWWGCVCKMFVCTEGW